jgi:hypothetical protein
MHNNGGYTCFIFNDFELFWTLTPSSFSVRQVDGSHITAEGSGVVIIHPLGSHHLLALWPSCYYPTAPQHKFSPNAIKHYLLLHLVQTEHASHLRITVDVLTYRTTKNGSGFLSRRNHPASVGLSRSYNSRIVSTIGLFQGSHDDQDTDPSRLWSYFR